MQNRRKLFKKVNHIKKFNKKFFRPLPKRPAILTICLVNRKALPNYDL